MAQTSKPRHHDGDGGHQHHFCPARINVGSDLNIDHHPIIKGENVILNSLGSINTGPGAGGSNEGSFSGSTNQGNLRHLEQHVGTMARESIRGKSKQYQQRTSAATGQGNCRRLSPKTF
ncbi:hypothetical protein SLA2020_411550 [Shorea laevis]